jgi:hypothetical protein
MGHMLAHGSRMAMLMLLRIIATVNVLRSLSATQDANFESLHIWKDQYRIRDNVRVPVAAKSFAAVPSAQVV